MALRTLDSAPQAAEHLRERVCGELRCDSRLVQPGDGFVAWPGHAVDARRYVASALAAGASACLVEADGVQAFGFDDERIAALPALKAAAGEVADLYYGMPSAALDLVAGTGTNGKSSTAWWLAQALTALGRRCALVGTLGIGEPAPPGGTGIGTLEATGLTTPDPVTLHAALRRFVDAGFEACAVEASSIGIAEQRLAGVRIAVAMFTNFTRDHLDYHGTMASYWSAKRRLFSWPGLKAASVNVDDLQGAALAAELRAAGSAALWTVSLAGPARLAARGLHYRDGGLAFEVVEQGGGSAAVASRFAGDYNASNLLVVIGALRGLGIALADAAAAVARLTPVPGRLEPVEPAAGVTRVPRVLVDYAHTPDALEKVLHALRPLAEARGGRLWCVFGCGGNRDATKRPLMGAIAARLADQVVITSDNPRDEPPAFILSQILAGVAGVAGRDGIDVLEDRAEAIGHAVRSAGEADVVLLAGKGHEPYQEVAGVRRPFSDAAVAAAMLQRRAAAQEARA